MSFRLGELRGSLAERQAALTALTAAICRSATAAATPAPAEVQIDFDAHVSQLPAFKHWLEDLHRCLPAIPLTFTALPSWLASPAFVELARAFPNYVLQLHWLQGSGAQRMLYDSAAAHRAVAAAAQLGVAFRIALPAYRYLAAFDATGELIGLEAERGARRYPPGSELSVVTVDWAQLAADVRGWTAAPPRGLAGIAWFRLPLTTDENSLSRADLGRIMQGLAPAGASGFEVTLRRKQPGLFDVVLRNRGHDPALLSADWRIAWRGPGRLVAWDGFAPFRAEADPASELVLRRTTTSHRDVLAPGEERLIGWLRFVPNNKEVTPYVRAN